VVRGSAWPGRCCTTEQLVKVLVRAEIPDDVQALYDAASIHSSGTARMPASFM
jgi:hypothetical protein